MYGSRRTVLPLEKGHPREKLTHLDDSGNAYMVSVSDKQPTKRSATARGYLTTTPHAVDLVRRHAVAKGDVLATARVAAIMAAKQTSALIPLCHPLALTKVSVELSIVDGGSGTDTCEHVGGSIDGGESLSGGGPSRIEVEATVETFGVTGVEMEALTACSMALLTCYDMLKAVDKRMVIGGVRVVRKRGGKSGDLDFNLAELDSAAITAGE